MNKKIFFFKHPIRRFSAKVKIISFERFYYLTLSLYYFSTNLNKIQDKEKISNNVESMLKFLTLAVMSKKSLLLLKGVFYIFVVHIENII